MDYNLDILNKVSDIIKRYEESLKLTGEKINTLEIISKDNKEVVICKLLAFLLNPKEYHYQGCNFLNLFLKELHIKEKVSDAKVITEYPTNNERRIDIVIKSEKIFIPIEVKINAKDQEKQCEDYFNYSKLFGAECVYYLTPNGREPNASSKGELVINENLRPISFQNEILTWLKKCNEIKDISDPLKELIRELIDTIKKICNNIEGNIMNREIFDEIIKAENKDAAKAIAEVVQETSDEQLTWKNFCSYVVKDNWGENAYKRDIDLPKAEVRNTLTITINNEVEIDFRENFKDIFIAIPNDKIDILISNIKKDYSSFRCDPPNHSGFNINKVKQFFLGKNEIDSFDLYKTLIFEKEAVIQKIKDFCCYVDEVTNEN